MSGLPPLPPKPPGLGFLKPITPSVPALGANLKPVQHNTKHIILAPTIVLDPQEINGKSIALLGSTGSGKSTSARRFMEEHIRLGLGFTVCDVENEYHFLKTLGEVVLAGPPVSMESISKKVDDFTPQSLQNFDSVKLDIKLSNSNEFYEMGKKAYLKKMNVVLLLAGIDEDIKKVYVKAYLQGVFEAATPENKHYHRIFIEEAHEMCPQGAGVQKDDPLLKQIIQIAKRGRKREISLCVMSQRPASLVKDVLTQCHIFLLHYVTYPNDMDIYEKICGLANVQVMVQQMKAGDCIYMNGRTQLQDRIYEPKTESTWTVNDVNLNHFKTISTINLEEMQKEIIDEQSESGMSVVPTKYLHEMEKLIPSLQKKISSMTEDATLQQNRIFELQACETELKSGSNYRAQATIEHINRLQKELTEVQDFVEPMKILHSVFAKKIKADLRAEFNQKLKKGEE
jgi:hypothetical protein